MEVSSILLSADGDQLVVMTAERHFVFKAPAPLVTALRSGLHSSMTAELGIVGVEPNGKTSVPVVLAMPAGTDEDNKEAMSMGFLQRFGDPSTLELRLDALKGVAYKANATVPPATLMSLNRTYRVTVSDTGAHLGYSDLPSPIRVLAEGSLAIAIVPLVVLALPLVLFVLPKGVGVGPLAR